jgi:hypothetical protein
VEDVLDELGVLLPLPAECLPFRVVITGASTTAEQARTRELHRGNPEHLRVAFEHLKRHCKEHYAAFSLANDYAERAEQNYEAVVVADEPVSEAEAKKAAKEGDAQANERVHVPTSEAMVAGGVDRVYRGAASTSNSCAPPWTIPFTALDTVISLQVASMVHSISAFGVVGKRV